MPYKIAGKFVSKEAYEKHMEAEKMTDTAPAKVERNVNPVVAATRRLTKAEKGLRVAKAAYDKQKDVAAAYEAAEAEYQAAADAVKDLLAA